MTRCFLDSNVLVYAIDQSVPDKRELALDLIEQHLLNRSGVLSTQVLQEFFVASTRKLGVDPVDAKNLVRDFQTLHVIQVTPFLIDAAIDRSILSQLSFWDSLIVESALLAKCSTLLSEDLGDGQRFDSCQVSNPFA